MRWRTSEPVGQRWAVPDDQPLKVSFDVVDAQFINIAVQHVTCPVGEGGLKRPRQPTLARRRWLSPSDDELMMDRPPSEFDDDVIPFRLRVGRARLHLRAANCLIAAQ